MMCSRNVLEEFFMNFRQGYINVGNKAEERRNEIESRKKEKNCELGVFGRTSDFNIFIEGTLGFYDYVLRPGNLFFDCKLQK